MPTTLGLMTIIPKWKPRGGKLLWNNNKIHKNSRMTKLLPLDLVIHGQDHI